MSNGLLSLRFDVRDGLFPGIAHLRDLRRRAYGKEEAGVDDPFDSHSFHVLASDACGRVVGAVRVTCRRDGPLESESAYPRWLLTECGDVLSACSRLCLDSTCQEGGVPLALMAHAWREGLRRGTRVDVSKVRKRAIRYYLGLGSHFVKGSLFTFHRWDVECGLVAMFASPDNNGPMRALFTNVHDPVDLLVRRPEYFTADYGEVRREMIGAKAARATLLRQPNGSADESAGRALLAD